MVTTKSRYDKNFRLLLNSLGFDTVIQKSKAKGLYGMLAPGYRTISAMPRTDHVKCNSSLYGALL